MQLHHALLWRCVAEHLVLSGNDELPCNGSAETWKQLGFLRKSSLSSRAQEQQNVLLQLEATLVGGVCKNTNDLFSYRQVGRDTLTDEAPGRLEG